MSVTRTPPNLSEITPPADRASAPIKGPKNASCRMFTSGNCVLASMAKPAEKPMNDPNVARYSRLSSHRCRRFSTGNCEATDAFELPISFIPNQAASVATASNGTQIQAALVRASREPSGCGTPWTPKKVNIGRKITSGASNCITLTPRFPSPPLIPNALPCLAFGKKKLMLPILDAKFAPAKPHNRAMSINTPKGVAGFCTANPSQAQGIINITVLNTVHLRPPNSGTIKE